MTKTELYNNKPTIAYYSGLNGLEIKEIIYGVDEYIISISGTWNGKKDTTKTKYIIITAVHIILSYTVTEYH